MRDCLQINWVVPEQGLPQLPSPLRFELQGERSDRWSFVSALLFHSSELPLAGGLSLPIAHPRCHFRFCVRDGEERAAYLLGRVLVPAWALPGVRLASHDPAVLSRLHYPHPSRELSEEGWWWRLRRSGRLVIHAWPSAPPAMPTPSLGSWEQAVSYFRSRRREYALADTEILPIDRLRLPVAAWPLTAQVEDSGLLSSCLGSWLDTSSMRFHSAWLYPEAGAEPLRERFGEVALQKSRSPVATGPAMLCSPDVRVAA